MKKIFYVCSYGGSGSKMLCNALSKYAISKHIHNRKQSNNIEYIEYENGGNDYYEWFNGVVIPEEKLKNYYVIFIYRNPSFSIPSRFNNPEHLEHIQIDKSIKLNDFLESKKDLYKIREFYDNYTKENDKRNYKIYCVKYEDIFEKQDKVSNLLNIVKLNIINESSRKDSNKELDNIYANLIDEMINNRFVIIS